MASDTGASDDHTTKGTAESIRLFNQLAIETRQQIWNDPEIIADLVTERPAETARKLSGFARIDRRSRDSIGDGTPLGKYRVRLNKLGSIAKKIHELVFPKEGLPDTEYNEPGSGQTRLQAGGDVIAFLSEGQQKKLVEDVLAIARPRPRIDAIDELTDTADFGKIEGKIQKPVIDVILHEWLNPSHWGESDPRHLVARVLKYLDDDHKALIGDVRLAIAREEADQPAPENPVASNTAQDMCDLDTQIDALGKTLDESPFKDMTTRDLMINIRPISQAVRTYEQVARRAVMDGIRPRAARGI